MRRTLLLIALLAVALMPRVSADVEANRPSLVPWPQKVTMREGSLTAPKSLSIGLAGKDRAAARRVAGTFADDLKEFGFSTAPASKSPTIVLALAPDKTLDDQGYRLKINKDIRITAATEAGLFWGTRTVLQLLAKGPGQPVRRMTVFDKPLLPLRVLMVDMARQFHSIGFHRRMVKLLASYKLNVYHMHFSDDESYTLPSAKYPSLPTPKRHYTKDELKDLVRFATRYHVTIIPEVEMPGHNKALCAALPDVVCRGKSPGRVVCAGSNASLEVLRNLISETTDIFPGPYFHIGADEVDYTAWDNCPDCRARKISEGLKDNQSLYNWFINRMNRYVRSKGRTTIVWTGFKPTTRPFIDKNVLVDQWDIGYADPRELLAAGYDLINSSSAPLYVVRDWSHSPEKIAEWNAWVFGFVNEPPPYLAPRMAPSKKLRGVGFCSWENAEEVQEAILFGIGESGPGYSGPAPRVPIMAERGWTGNSTTAEDLLARVGWKAGK